jgi:hypothetical protein
MNAGSFDQAGQSIPHTNYGMYLQVFETLKNPAIKTDGISRLVML